jgi:hypothetical protein
MRLIQISTTTSLSAPICSGGLAEAQHDKDAGEQIKERAGALRHSQASQIDQDAATRE